jgi:hypothetical protein
MDDNDSHWRLQAQCQRQAMPWLRDEYGLKLSGNFMEPHEGWCRAIVGNERTLHVVANNNLEEYP